MRESDKFVVPINILTLFVRALFFWAAQHTAVCLDICDRILENLPFGHIYLVV